MNNSPKNQPYKTPEPTLGRLCVLQAFRRRIQPDATSAATAFELEGLLRCCRERRAFPATIAALATVARIRALNNEIAALGAELARISSTVEAPQP